MTPEAALSGWIEGQMAGIVPPTTVAEAAAVMGGTGKLAEAIGVSQRSVQRYIKAERGEPGETRRPSPVVAAALRQTMQEAGVRALAARLREQGLTVHEVAGDVRVSNDARNRVIHPAMPVDIPGAALDQFTDALIDGDLAAAVAAFASEFFTSYAGAGDAEFQSIEQLVME